MIKIKLPLSMQPQINAGSLKVSTLISFLLEEGHATNTTDKPIEQTCLNDLQFNGLEHRHPYSCMINLMTNTLEVV